LVRQVDRMLMDMRAAQGWRTSLLGQKLDIVHTPESPIIARIMLGLAYLRSSLGQKKPSSLIPRQIECYNETRGLINTTVM
jgi:hypothetical protein